MKNIINDFNELREAVRNVMSVIKSNNGILFHTNIKKGIFVSLCKKYIKIPDTSMYDFFDTFSTLAFISENNSILHIFHQSLLIKYGLSWGNFFFPIIEEFSSYIIKGELSTPLYVSRNDVYNFGFTPEINITDRPAFEEQRYIHYVYSRVSRLVINSNLNDLVGTPTDFIEFVKCYRGLTKVEKKSAIWNYILRHPNISPLMKYIDKRKSGVSQIIEDELNTAYRNLNSVMQRTTTESIKTILKNAIQQLGIIYHADVRKEYVYTGDTPIDSQQNNQNFYHFLPSQLTLKDVTNCPNCHALIIINKNRMEQTCPHCKTQYYYLDKNKPV